MENKYFKMIELVDTLILTYGHTFLVATSIIGAFTLIVTLACIPWQIYDYIKIKLLKRKLKHFIKVEMRTIDNFLKSENILNN